MWCTHQVSVVHGRESTIKESHDGRRLCKPGEVIFPPSRVKCMPALANNTPNTHAISHPLHSVTQPLAHSLAHPLTTYLSSHSLTTTSPTPPSHSFTHSFAHAITHAFTPIHSPNHSRASFSRWLTHSLTHPLTRALTHLHLCSLALSLTYFTQCVCSLFLSAAVRVCG